MFLLFVLLLGVRVVSNQVRPCKSCEVTQFFRVPSWWWCLAFIYFSHYSLGYLKFYPLFIYLFFSLYFSKKKHKWAVRGMRARSVYRYGLLACTEKIWISILLPLETDIIQEMLEFVGYVWGKFGLETVSSHFVTSICSVATETQINGNEDLTDRRSFTFAAWNVKRMPRSALRHWTGIKLSNG